MKMIESDIIDWMINNESFIEEVCEKVINRRIEAHILFQEEANVQFGEEVVKEVVDMVTKDLGCTAEDFHSTVSEEMFNNFLSKIGDK